MSAADVEGDRAVHYAVIGLQPTCLKYLLERGADPDAANKKNCSPLTVAVVLGSEECVRVLLTHPKKADVNWQDGFGDTPLHEAIMRRNDAVMDLLCAAPGIDFDLRYFDVDYFWHRDEGG